MLDECREGGLKIKRKGGPTGLIVCRLSKEQVLSQEKGSGVEVVQGSRSKGPASCSSNWLMFQAHVSCSAHG